jgi:hypothetical protein
MRGENKYKMKKMILCSALRREQLRRAAITFEQSTGYQESENNQPKISQR